MTDEHKLRWFETKLGGFAQCMECYFIFPNKRVSDCAEYVDPETERRLTKEKKQRDLEKRKVATIAYLKSKGLPYTL